MFMKISAAVFLLIAQHAHPSKPTPVVPVCFDPASLLSAADNDHMKTEQFGLADIRLVEAADKTGFIRANVGDSELLVVVHPLPGSNNALLFVFNGGCFDNVAEMPDDRFRVLMDRTRS